MLAESGGFFVWRGIDSSWFVFSGGVLSISALGGEQAVPAGGAGPLDEAAAARFAHLALACLHKEYPNKIGHVLASEADVLPPHLLTPAFYGCFDWHSDVHGHWLLVRLLRLVRSEERRVGEEC